MIKLILLLLFIPFNLYAQIDLAQDSPDIKWKKIENENFKIVFPDYAENSAQYVLNLLTYYKPIVDKTYSQHSKKLTVVIRANVAEPNGFVTLAPRRSEWFLSRGSSPLIGSLDWLQALAVHEYRHVTQFDFLNRSNNKLGYFLGGEELLGTLLVISIPSWFFEGDAVWTETKYSDAGRGRSPRFSKRLKALLLSNQIPSLDQILAGDFTKPLPNLYVYGYFLITKGVNDYGEDIWQQVAARSSDSSLNPYALYHAFKEVTGKGFETFYNEMLEELKVSWKKDYSIAKDGGDYTEYAYPIFDKDQLYFLKKDIKSFWSLYSLNSKSKKPTFISELAVTPELHRIDIRNEKMLYIQNLPDNRYGYKSFSDLFLFDIKTKKQTQLTMEKRYTHPKFNQNGSKFLAIRSNPKNNWSIDLFTKEGKIFKTYKGTKNRQFVEAVWGDNKDLFAIALDEGGRKKIVRIDYYLNKNEIIDLTFPTRNNIYSLSYYKGKLFFEADDKGVVNILSLDTRTLGQTRCTNVAIAASYPFATNDSLYYIETTGYGSELRETPIQCSLIETDFLEKSSKYLGNSPSDNYIKSKPVSLINFKKLQAETENVFEYSEYKSALIPHSWSVLGGRGLEISANSTNILNSLDLYAAIGSDPEESANYGSLALTYRKYYPIISLGLRFSERQNDLEEDDEDEKIRWSENTYIASMTLPYIFQKNLYSGYHLLTGFAEHITIGDSEGEVDYGLDNESLTGLGFIYQFSFKKETLPTQLNPELGMDFTFLYEDVNANEESSLDSYFGSASMNIFLPGLEKLHSTHFGVTGEYRPESELKYKVQDKYFPIIGYTFSRGYSYEYTPEFHKVEFNYALPLGYPNYDLWHFAFFKRISGRYFFDHTEAELDGMDKALNSTGLEFDFDTVFFRKFPVSLGLRYIEKLREREQVAEFFISI